MITETSHTSCLASEARRDQGTAALLERAMSLRGLRDRLTEIIERNEERGWEERNDLPVTIRYRTGSTPLSTKRRPVRAASSAMVGSEDFYTVELKAGPRVDEMDLMDEEEPGDEDCLSCGGDLEMASPVGPLFCPDCDTKPYGVREEA